MDTQNRFYHRGKSARRAGLPCTLSDARIKPENRREWFAGWHAQDKHERSKTEVETLATEQVFSAFLSDLKREINS